MNLLPIWKDVGFEFGWSTLPVGVLHANGRRNFPVGRYLVIEPGDGAAKETGDEAAPDGPTMARLHLPGTLLVWAALGAVLLFIALWLASTHVFAGNSDGATVILEGKSMSSGNLLLSGWSLSLDSFWGVDAFFYMLATEVVGVRGYLLHAVPAGIALCVVVLGAIMARDARHTGRGVAGVVAAVVLLGAPTGALSVVYLTGPLHVGTALWSLVAFFALRKGRFGPSWALAVVFLALGLLGDLQTLPLGVAPVIGVGLTQMARHHNWRSGAHAVSAGVGGLVGAVVVRGIARAVGTYSIGRANAPAPLAQIPANITHLPTFVAWLFGITANVFHPAHVSKVVAISHAIGLLVVAGSVAMAVIGLLGGLRKGRPLENGRHRIDGRLDGFLAVAFLADVVTYVVITPTGDPTYVRYLTAGYIFGAILAARTITRVAERRGSTPGGRLAGAVALAAVVGYGTGLVGEVFAPPLPNPAVQLAGFLRAHHLRRGVGDYWSSSITTVVSNNKVVIRPVATNNAGHLVRYGRQSSARWYKGKRFQFVVYNPTLPWGGVTPAVIGATFGAWSKSYTVGPYVVYTWDKAIRVGPVGWG